MKKEAEKSEAWMGKLEEENLKQARLFINKMEMITDLCVYKPNRVIDVDDKKKKGEDLNDGEDEEEGED